MGITATLYNLAEDEFKNLPDDEFEVINILIPSDIYSNERFCNLDKSWSVIHYLLCGSPEPDGSVLGDAILGGEETKIEMDYGPAKYRPPSRVAEINNALANVDLEERYDKLVLSSEALKDVYLSAEFAEEGVESIQGFFDELKGFYAKAASENLAIVSYLA